MVARVRPDSQAQAGRVKVGCKRSRLDAGPGRRGLGDRAGGQGGDEQEEKPGQQELR